jgi:hypothetical protein
VTRKILITSVAALLAGTVMAAGQENQRNQPSAQPGAAQEHQAPKAQPQGQREQKTPAQQPSSRAQDRNQRPSTTGQGQREEPQTAPTQRREGQDGKRPNEERREGQDNRRNEERREGQDNRRDRTQGQNDRDRNQREQGQNPREDRREGRDNRDNNRDRTQGQGPGRAGASVTLTTEQRTRIRESVLVGGHAPRATNINFQIRVGTTIPRSVHLVTVAPEIVEFYPAWRGFMYFVYEDEIIIVDPRSHKIVAVLDV